MNGMNLRPPAPGSRRTRRRLPQGVLLPVLVGSLMLIGWAAFAWHARQSILLETAVARERIALLQEETGLAEAQLLKMITQHERTLAIASLRNPVPPGGVLAVLDEHLPDDTALKRLDLEIAPPNTEAWQRSRKPGTAAATLAAPRPIPTPTRLRFDGFATSPTSAARVVNALEATGHVRGTRLTNSREVAEQNERWHAFQIACEIITHALGRDY